MGSNDKEILVIDDDDSALTLIRDILEPEGYKLIFAADGNTALRIINEKELSLILLDIMLPDVDGYTICN
jgi:CheY-like chemotaxis protein